MSQLTGTGPVVVGQDLLVDSSSAVHSIGELVHSNDGRAFRYTKAGGTALLAGTLQQSAAEITNHQDLTAPVAAVGDTSLTVTLGATAATADQYAGGYLMVTVTPGVGVQYLISGHPAASASATLLISLADPIEVALTATSRLDMVLNPYSGTLIYPVTATSGPCSVAVKALTASQYGWTQVAGIANVLSDGATAVGNFVSAATGSVAGAVIDATHVAEPAVGTAMTGIADTQYGAIKLALL